MFKLLDKINSRGNCAEQKYDAMERWQRNNNASDFFKYSYRCSWKVYLFIVIVKYFRYACYYITYSLKKDNGNQEHNLMKWRDINSSSHKHETLQTLPIS